MLISCLLTTKPDATFTCNFTSLYKTGQYFYPGYRWHKKKDLQDILKKVVNCLIIYIKKPYFCVPKLETQFIYG